MPDAQGARTPSQAGYAGTSSQNAETSQSKLPPRSHEQTNPSSPRARAISGSAPMKPERKTRALVLVAAGLSIVLFGMGMWLTLRPRAPSMPQIDVTSLPIEPEAARDMAVAHHQPVVEPFEPAPLPTPPVVAAPAPAPPPERRERHPTPAATHAAKPAQPGAKKPKIEVFDDSEQPAPKPKIETFDD